MVPAIQAARMGKHLAHILLQGPPGTGKTTLANLLAGEMGTKCVVIDAANVKTPLDFYNCIKDLNTNDFVFVDEIHGLDIRIEEMLYGVLDRFEFPYVMQNGRIITLPCPKFVLVGATTLPAGLTGPLRTRFGITAQLEHYTVAELEAMAFEKVCRLEMFIGKDGAADLAVAARGTARILDKLLDRVHDLAMIKSTDFLTAGMCREALENLGIDRMGLNDKDRKFLRVIKEVYKNQPTGLSALAATLGDSEDNLAEVVEPYLLREGFIIRTPRGRVLSHRGLEVS